MYELTKKMPVYRLVVEQGPALLLALGLAEVFFRFHSFSLECLAFLATWYLADAGLALLRALLRGGNTPPRPKPEGSN